MSATHIKILSAIFFLLFLASIYPAISFNNSLKTAQAELDASNSAISIVQEKINLIEKEIPHKHGSRKIEEEIAELSEFVVLAKTNYLVIFENLNTQGDSVGLNENGVQIQTMIKPVTNSQSSKMIPISVKGSYADYDLFRKFLYDFTHKMSISIVSLTINEMSFSMEFEVYGK